jgi:protease-4
MRRSLQEARRNKDVKAIVLVLTVPEEVHLHQIWRELELTKSKADSGFYGNYAASGGYYIA